ncbi:MAG TPA: type II toxin-antitoxin system VapC family toxin [Caulobacteraceae bacterium]|nr:type II toxin-antitoxin system VapC family toxin [Caulobacteraceae bacterium]
MSRIVESFEDLVRRSLFRELAITLAHALKAGSLGGKHRDPFDRILIAQAQAKPAIIVTANPVFRHYNIPVIWDAASASASP